MEEPNINMEAIHKVHYDDTEYFVQTVPCSRARRSERAGNGCQIDLFNFQLSNSASHGDYHLWHSSWQGWRRSAERGNNGRLVLLVCPDHLNDVCMTIHMVSGSTSLWCLEVRLCGVRTTDMVVPCQLSNDLAEAGK